MSSQMKQCLVSWDLHHDSKSAGDVFTSILTCACIGFTSHDIRSTLHPMTYAENASIMLHLQQR